MKDSLVKRKHDHKIFIRKSQGISLEKGIPEFKESEIGIVICGTDSEIFVITSSGKFGWIYAHEAMVVS